MEKGVLIQRRNYLLLGLLWSFYILDSIVYMVIEHNLQAFWPPVGLIICLGLTLLSRKQLNPYYLMVLNIIGVYIFLFYVNYSNPYLVNYLFFILGIIISAFYQSFVALFLSSILAISCLVFFYIVNGELIMKISGSEDYPYIILLAVLTSILLVFMIKYANNLWSKAHQNELKAKKDLSSTKSIVEAFFRNTNDGIAVIDLELKIVEMNQSFMNLLGMQLNMVDEKLSDFIIDTNGDFKILLENAKNGKGFAGAEVPIETSLGDQLILEATISPVYDQDNQIFAVSLIIRDITEKKKLEDYLRNTEKLKLAGEMAAGVAHEIRNPLTVISGFLQMMSENDHSNPQYFSIIHKEIARMNAIISEFLMLSRPQAFNPKSYKLSDLIQEIILLYESEAHFKNIEVVKQCKHTYDMVFCDVNQLKQVFINLLKNAFEALPNGGRIYFECRNLSDEELIIIIQDDGKGIPAELLNKIGQPFFTTKENGTGLGLMISEKIIKKHNGKMTITSTEQIGTKVEIILPVYKS